MPVVRRSQTEADERCSGCGGLVHEAHRPDCHLVKQEQTLRKLKRCVAYVEKLGLTPHDVYFFERLMVEEEDLRLLKEEYPAEEAGTTLRDYLDTQVDSVMDDPLEFVRDYYGSVFDLYQRTGGTQ